MAGQEVLAAHLESFGLCAVLAPADGVFVGPVVGGRDPAAERPVLVAGTGCGPIRAAPPEGRATPIVLVEGHLGR